MNPQEILAFLQSLAQPQQSASGGGAPPAGGNVTALPPQDFGAAPAGDALGQILSLFGPNVSNIARRDMSGGEARALPQTPFSRLDDLAQGQIDNTNNQTRQTLADAAGLNAETEFQQAGANLFNQLSAPIPAPNPQQQLSGLPGNLDSSQGGSGVGELFGPGFAEGDSRVQSTAPGPGIPSAFEALPVSSNPAGQAGFGLEQDGGNLFNLFGENETTFEEPSPIGELISGYNPGIVGGSGGQFGLLGFPGRGDGSQGNLNTPIAQQQKRLEQQRKQKPARERAFGNPNLFNY